MNPDMKRLCEAVSKFALEWTKDGEVEIIGGNPEAIVRAVLMELREPPPDVGMGQAQMTFQRQVDAILAEPVKA
jgi:hypothetical protein